MLKIDMTDKTALVIGGARGIGAAVCNGLLSNGCDVACTHLGGQADDAGAAELMSLAQSMGRDFQDAVIDCTDQDATVAFVTSLESRWGHLDYLVYSAGFTSPVSFSDLTIEQWRRVVDINLNGAFIAIHAALPLMIRQGGGSIVMIGSAAVTSGGGGRADYVSAKAGMEGLNLAITKEFSKHNIRSNIVHPSLIETDLLKARYADPAKRAEVAQGVPLGRLGQPDDVASLVSFLLSDHAGYITGQGILVDGGRSYCG
jgi:NAD(P)-dependent dehydrogenase (short-subunit alcohol dehydrogenase family)